MSYELLGSGGDDWVEIVGEQLRGGGRATVAGAEYEILGELMAKSPALQRYVKETAAARIGASKPIIQKTPMSAAQDWQVDFGPVSGAAGTSTTITVNPQCHFRGEKVSATDSNTVGAGAGYGTRVSTILIGNKLQRPASTATLTAFFAPDALGNGVKWNTCEKGLSIAVTILFAQACTFDMTVWGKALM